MADNVAHLRELVASYEFDREIEQSRLDRMRSQWAMLELAREDLIEHADAEGAQHLHQEIYDLNAKIGAAVQTLAHVDQLLNTFRQRLYNAPIRP